MASFQSILKVGGKEYDILYSDLGLGQAVDSLGRPASAVYGGMITIEMNTPANDPTLYEWMVNPEKRMDGQIILRRLDSRATLKSIKFYNAYCVDMVIRFDGTANASSFKMTIRISPEQIEIGGLLHDNLWPDESPMGYIPDESAPEDEKKKEPSALSEGLHTLLDVVGMIPIVGEIADGANALLYAAEGDYAGAAMAAAAMIPLAGNFVGAAKLAKRGLQIAKKVQKLMPPIPKKVIGKIDEAFEAGKKACTEVGHPIDVATGTLFTDKIDFSLPGPIPLVWERTWYSASDHQGPLGYGWHHAYDMGLTLDAETDVPVLRMADGRQVAFEPSTVPNESVFDRRSGLALQRPGDNGTAEAPAPWLVWDKAQGVWYVFAPPASDGTYQPLHTIENVTGQFIGFRYNAGNRQLEQITDSAGRVLQVSYNERGNISAIRAPHPDEDGAQLQLIGYAYDERGNLTTVTDAEGYQMQFVYEGHQLVQETNAVGLSFYFEYEANSQADLSARCVHTWGDGDIFDTKLEYVDAQTTLVRNSYDHQDRYIHQNGLVTERTNALGHRQQWVYNDYSQLLAQMDGLGQITRYRYDERGNRLSTTYPDGTSLKTLYDATDKVVGYTDARGNTWQYTYAEQGLLTQQTDPLGATTDYSYDEQGRLITATNALNQATQLRYTEQHQVAHVVSPNEQIRSRAYDALGRLVKLTDPTGAEQQRQYDKLGQLVRVVKPDGSEQALVYDGVGNVLEARQGEQAVSFAYTGQSRLAERRQAGGRMGFSYDREGRLVGLTNEAEEQYRFELDALGQVVTEVGFDRLTRRYERDAAGQVTKILRPAERSTEYKYNETGRITVVAYSDGTKYEYNYDEAGNLVKARTGDNMVELERNVLGRIIVEQQNEFLVNSDYNLLGQRQGITSSLGADISINLDADERLTRMQAGSWQADFAYDQRGLQVQRQLSGGLSTQWEYDAFGRPTQQRINNQLSAQTRLRSYKWEGVNQLLSIDDSLTGLSQYQYDPVGTLVEAVYSDGTRDVRQTDAVGNLYRSVDRRDRQYGLGGQLRQSEDGSRYRYDAEGNLIRKTLTDGSQWHYSWDGAGQLTGVKRPDGYTVSFTYDALGRRLSKQFRGRTTRWVWDGNKPLHEWTELAVGSGADGVEDVITWIFEEDSFAPLAKLTDKASYSVITDHLGTPIEMYGQEGLKTWSTQLDTYGSVRRGVGKIGDCPFRYQGQYEDVETNLYYNRFRYYAPQEGMYLSQDTVGLLGGMPTLYSYVREPNSEVDVLGLTTLIPGQALPDGTKLYRIGGGDITNLGLKPKELGLSPPGISVIRANSAQEAGEIMKRAFPKATNLHASIDAGDIAETTAERIRGAGFDVIHDPTRNVGDGHARLIHPDGADGFNNENIKRLSEAFGC